MPNDNEHAGACPAAGDLPPVIEALVVEGLIGGAEVTGSAAGSLARVTIRFPAQGSR